MSWARRLVVSNCLGQDMLFGFLDNTDQPDTNYLRGYQLLLFGDALTAINRLFRPRSVLGNTDEQHKEIPADL